MLTKELLEFRARQGQVKPASVDATDPELLGLAEEIISAIQMGLGRPQGELEKTLAAIAGADRKTKRAKGLVKLALDRTTLAEVATDAMAERKQVLLAAQTVRGALPPEATFADYEAALATLFELTQTRARLFRDLPELRPVVGFEACSPEALLHRYNLASAQGLLLYAQTLVITLPQPELLALRRVLRWLKFQRLVAEMERQPQAVVLKVEGPATLFESSKRYGLQLAQFFAVLPLIERWSLTTVVNLPNRPPLVLQLSEQQGLVSHLSPAMGYVPEELQQIVDKLADSPWQVDPLPEPRPMGANGFCVPDFGLRHPQHGYRAVELFHGWHRRLLLRRLDELQSRPDPELVLGVEKGLTTDSEVAARVQHPQVFVFNTFPTVRALMKVVENRVLE